MGVLPSFRRRPLSANVSDDIVSLKHGGTLILSFLHFARLCAQGDSEAKANADAGGPSSDQMFGPSHRGCWKIEGPSLSKTSLGGRDDVT
jgi:hypothetical protein